jgi:hypothetical protein
VSITNGSQPIDTQAVAAQALGPAAVPRAAGGVVGRFVGRIFGNAVSSAVGTAAGTATAAVLVPELQDIVNDQWAAHPNRPLPAHDAAAAVERDAMTYGAAEAEAAKRSSPGTTEPASTLWRSLQGSRRRRLTS